MTKLEQLETILGHRFTDKTLLRQALRHPSYVAERPEEGADNQRLEFLGDAVLQLMLSEQLFNRFPDLQEGKLTKLRTALVRDHALAEFAKTIGLMPFLLLGHGDERNGGRERTSTLADTLEAVLAALYLDGGADAVNPLCRRLATALMHDPEKTLAEENPKGALQEFLADRDTAPPLYEVQSMSGPEHKPNFTVVLRVEEEIIARACASNRKEAEKRAARKGLDALRK